MQIVKPEVKIIDEFDPYKKIERIGRICYKSEDKITDTSAIPFVNGLKDHQHFAMLEHAYLHFAFIANNNHTDPFEAFANIPGVIITRWIGNLYLISVSLSHLYNPKWEYCFYILDLRHWFEYIYEDISGNTQLKLPDDIEIKLLNRIEEFQQFARKYDPTCVPSSYDIEELIHKHKVVSIYFKCDRGVSHELVRHRCSVAQSSTRYCNYSKAKFGSEITFIEPSTYDNWNQETRQKFEDYLENCESLYMYMIQQGLQPQQARAILPNALMTEVVLTMPIDRWKHFINIRSLGTTGAPHPDMKVIADKAKELLADIF